MTFKKIFLLILIFTILLSFNAVNALEDINSSDTVDQSIDLSIDDENINVEDNSYDEDTVLNAADGDVLKDGSNTSSEENSQHVVYVGPNTEDGNGSYDNPFKTLKIAVQKTENVEKNLTIKFFEGTHIIENTAFWSYTNVIMEPVSGEVILKPKPHNSVELTFDGWYWKINNLIFDASDLTGSYYRLTGTSTGGEIYNCTFRGFNKNPILYWLRSLESSLIVSNCKFIDIDNPTGYILESFGGQFKYCIFSANCSRFISTFSKNVTLEDVWLGSNTIPSSFNITDDLSFYPIPIYFHNCSLIINRHAIFSISENYINDTAYEIVGKLMWNDSTSDGIDQLGPMNVTLSSTTGELPDTAVFKNGTFRVIYRSNSKDHTVTAKLDFEELELNFETADIDVSVEDILIGQYANITVTLPDNSNGIVNVVVNNKTYTINVTDSSSVNIIVDEILNEGEYTVYATFKDEINQVYGESSTNFTVSKIEDYQINIIVPNEAKFGDNVSIIVNLPIDATGNLTVSVDGKNYTQTLVNGSATVNVPALSAGNHNIVITYSGDDKYAPIIKNTTINIPKPKLAANDVTIYYNSGYKYKIRVTLNGVAVKGKKVTIKFNKKTYTLITDKNGYAILKIDAKPGKYTITVTYNKVKVTKKVTVKSIVSAKNLKVKKSAKTLKIIISLKNVNKKYLKDKLTLKFNGKTYKAKINKKGVATFIIKKNVLKKLKVGKKYTYKVSYLKDSVNKKITVKK